MGALIKRKGVHHLLEAWKKLGLKNAELVLVGTAHPEMKPHLDAVVGDASIRLVGFTKSVEEELRNASVFVFPSECEGFAKATLEAAACGLPLIATRESGDAIVDGETGWVIPPNDAGALWREKLNMRIGIEDALTEMGNAPGSAGGAILYVGPLSPPTASRLCQSDGFPLSEIFHFAWNILRYDAGSVPRFLFIQLKRLGDLILTAPAVAALREAQPQSEIVMLTTKGAAELACCIRGADRVITYHRGAANLEAWSSAFIGPWDACLDFTGTDRSALLTSLTKATERVGYAKFAENKLRRRAYTHLCKASVRDLHTVDFHRALVEELQGAQRAKAHAHPKPAARLDYFEIPETARSQISEKLAKAGISGAYAVVHPGTAREEKSWQAEKWAEVIKSVRTEFSLPIVLTGSGDGWEREHLDDIKRRLAVPVLDLSHQLSLVELAALIQGCSLMVGVDSMAMHLAAMFERPQVALFGPTNPFHWRPRHDRGLVVTSNSPLPMQRLRIHACPRGRKAHLDGLRSRCYS